MCCVFGCNYNFLALLHCIIFTLNLFATFNNNFKKNIIQSPLFIYYQFLLLSRHIPLTTRVRLCAAYVLQWYFALMVVGKRCVQDCNCDFSKNITSPRRLQDHNYRPHSLRVPIHVSSRAQKQAPMTLKATRSAAANPHPVLKKTHVS